MAEATRKGTHKFYKGIYSIDFYTNDKYETFIASFNNVREILVWQEKEITRNNVILLNTEIARALKRDNHYTRCLDGNGMKVYITSLIED